MGFQTTVSLTPGLGVAGDIYNDGPYRAQSYILTSDDAAYNVFGRAFTITGQGVAKAGGLASLPFAGILVNSKVHALLGTAAGGSLAPSLTLPNYTQADLMTEGSCIVALAAAAAIGDLVVYDVVTGVLSTIAPGANLPVGKAFTCGIVDYYTVSGAGLAVITLTPTLTIPVLA